MDSCHPIYRLGLQMKLRAREEEVTGPHTQVARDSNLGSFYCIILPSVPLPVLRKYLLLHPLKKKHSWGRGAAGETV